MDGESLRPYFSNPEDKDRIVFGETDYPLRFGWAPLRSVRADGFKFIDAPRPELYDLNRDPQEETNDYEPWNANVQKFRACWRIDVAKARPLQPRLRRFLKAP